MNGGNTEPHRPKGIDRTRVLGIVLLGAPILFWVAAPAVVLFPLTGPQKVWTSATFLVLGEVAFWAAALALGREVFSRYRRFLDPRSLFGKKRR